MDDGGDIPAAALEALPIFPLPDLVLFPNALLPLHIFEPRYREMMRDVVAGGGLLAVVRLRPGYEADYHGRPPVFETATVGRCLSAVRLPDGRWNIMVRGLARVRFEEELAPEQAYRRVRARVLADGRSTRAGELGTLSRELLALCDRLAASVPDGEPLRQLSRTVPTPGGCADVVASALVRDPDLRQTLLELLDPADRLAQLCDYVARLVAQLGPGARTVN
jgi:Lon protease-like protein